MQYISFSISLNFNWAAARNGHLETVQWLAGNGGSLGRSVTQPSMLGTTRVAVASSKGQDSTATFLTAASSWPAFKTLVACHLVIDAKRALRNPERRALEGA